MKNLMWTMLQCVVLLLTVMTSLVDSQRIILRSGRRVCRQEKIAMTPVTRTKSVCIPFYRRSYRPCPYQQRGLCPFVRLVYRTEFRRVKEMVPQRYSYFSCCPGWTGYDVKHSTCHTPLCDPRCHHGGNCRLPNRCECTGGWNGTSCQSDIDECSSSPCDQKCTNTGGSFRCDCFQGYRLDQDEHSCTLCLACTDEFTSILQDQKMLQRTVIKLEKHNHIMMKNLTTLHEDLQTLTSLPRPTTTTPTPTPTDDGEAESVGDLSDELDAYVSSISEQIAMLEERLDVCTCVRSSSSQAINGNMKHHIQTGHWPRTSVSRRLRARHRPETTITDKITSKTTTPTTTQYFFINRPPSK